MCQRALLLVQRLLGFAIESLSLFSAASSSTSNCHSETSNGIPGRMVLETTVSRSRDSAMASGSCSSLTRQCSADPRALTGCLASLRRREHRVLVRQRHSGTHLWSTTLRPRHSSRCHLQLRPSDRRRFRARLREEPRVRTIAARLASRTVLTGFQVSAGHKAAMGRSAQELGPLHIEIQQASRRRNYLPHQERLTSQALLWK